MKVLPPTCSTQTDRQTAKVAVAFPYFANAPKNGKAK